MACQVEWVKTWWNPDIAGLEVSDDVSVAGGAGEKMDKIESEDPAGGSSVMWKCCFFSADWSAIALHPQESSQASTLSLSVN